MPSKREAPPLAARPKSAESRRNVLFIYVEDLGYFTSGRAAREPLVRIADEQLCRALPRSHRDAIATVEFENIDLSILNLWRHGIGLDFRVFQISEAFLNSQIVRVPVNEGEQWAPPSFRYVDFSVTLPTLTSPVPFFSFDGLFMPPLCPAFKPIGCEP